MSAQMSAQGSPVPAVTRASALLDALAAAGGAPLSVSELARQLGLAKSSTANLCLALESERLVVRGDTGYTLGRRLVELGGAYLSTVDQVREFYAACRRAPLVSGLTARVAVLEGLDVLYLARYDGAQPIRLTANIGDRFPAHCTATGKVLMAAMAPAALDERLRGRTLAPLTERSITDHGQLRSELERVRAQGFGLDDEETTPGVVCVAIAVPGARTDSDTFAISATTVTTGPGGADTLDLQAVRADLETVAEALGNPLVVAR
ncbi:IclR family transcriptional regulator [Pseudokineococcus sp. 1T1Z-3]|uniref:IclR family transcriptional regulator n=1 Tax=Pseudokineococcus sp. 1T1Z-3 TaxID=3132745 RepID=UPI0030AB8884